ncbi:DUF1294 domain-containing protein [Paenibacillus yanchengensis]|uniref:DUF1294 domain-containing protein n=1 Tax=Paenibacillus yanchengensis TaxID=2035833 RepID=A0ABW4YLX6_9BACL
MSIWSLIAVIYYVIINGYCFWLVKDDKVRAKTKKRRINEKRFFVCSLLGGAPAVFLAMHLYRHKTKHRSFVIGVPALLVLHIGIIYGIVQIIQFYFY